MKSSPYTQKIVKQAFERMQSGASDKAPTREETEARLAARKQESIKQSAANLPKLESELAQMKSIHEKGKNWAYSRQRPKHDS
jgi:guanylate kinase